MQSRRPLRKFPCIELVGPCRRAIHEIGQPETPLGHRAVLRRIELAWGPSTSMKRGPEPVPGSPKVVPDRRRIETRVDPHEHDPQAGRQDVWQRAISARVELRCGRLHALSTHRSAAIAVRASAPTRTPKAGVSTDRDTSPPSRYFSPVIGALEHRAQRRALWALALALMIGCADAAEPPAEEEEVESYRLGRVHVSVEHRPDEAKATAETLSVTARFAFVEGLPERFARARIDMPVLALDVLDVNQCARESWLASTDDLDPEGDSPTDRALVLADAGALELQIGERRTSLPLSLVPDLLPYMSGVEYVYVGDELAPRDVVDLSIRSQGSDVDGLPAFEVESRLPPEVDLQLDAAAPEGVLPLRWDGGGGVPLVLKIVSARAGRAIGEPLVCVLEDTGEARISMSYLVAEGLPTHADALQLEVARSELSHFTAGEFVGAELLIERKSSLLVALRPST